MFVRPKDREREIWDGFRAGVEGAVATYGADAAHPVADMEAKLEEHLARGGTLWYRLGFSREWDERVVRIIQRLRARIRTGVRAPDPVRDPGSILHEQRLVKAPEELEKLRRAAEITAEAHMAAMRDGRPGAREYQVQSEIEYAFRRRGGNGPGYGTIVAAGSNATVLHYRAGNAELKAGDLCLVDAGGEYGLYTADVTRTFPVSGEFSKAQRKAYDVVLAAEEAGIAAVKPGITIDALHDLVVRKLVEGMISHRAPARHRRRSASPTGRTRSTTCTAPATGWAWTCTTWARTTSTETPGRSGRGTSSPSSPGSTWRPTTPPRPRSCAASASASRTTSWSHRRATRTSPRPSRSHPTR